jgi:hypothetical protein
LFGVPEQLKLEDERIEVLAMTSCRENWSSRGDNASSVCLLQTAAPTKIAPPSSDEDRHGEARSKAEF